MNNKLINYELEVINVLISDDRDLVKFRSAIKVTRDKK